MLGLASGARTVKMKFGHHGANHPVQDLDSGRVFITSQNHGFAVDEASLPENAQAPRTARCSTARCRASRAPTARPSASRATRRRAPVRTTWAAVRALRSPDAAAAAEQLKLPRRTATSAQATRAARRLTQQVAEASTLTAMPKRTDIESILIIGAGPIIIGQACEFDYSGAQACKALREEGYRVILVNSNPATIMTDPEMADAIYIEPINWRTRRAHHREGAPGCAAADHGRADRAQHRARPGARGRAGEVRRRDDRRLARRHRHGRGPRAVPQRDARDRPGDAAQSQIARSLERRSRSPASSASRCVIRPSFTMGGSGGGIAYNREEFETDRRARPRCLADRRSAASKSR